MPKNAIIVGMPRSGTSLTANIFAQQGYCVSHTKESTVRNGDDYNPFGYFEADDLIENNVEVFRQAGYDCHNTWLFEPISADIVERIRQLPPFEGHGRFVELHDRQAPWFWKDPRLCYTLPYWWKLVDPAETRVLLVRRDPMDIYRSFRRKGWCALGKSARADVLQRVDEHIAAAEDAIQSLEIPHLKVDYADYLKQPEDVAKRMSDFFELTLSADDLNVRPDLNHSTARGWISRQLLLLLKKLPRRPVRSLERIVPRRLVAWVFPERRYTNGEKR